MIVTGIDDLFVLDDRIFHAVHERPAYAAAVSGIDESVLGAGIESVFPVDELGVQHDIALLAGGDDVGETFPGAQVLCARYACGCDGGRKVAGRSRRILALYAEHVVNIRGRLAIFGHSDGALPETESVHSPVALRNGEKGLAVGAFNPDHHIVSAIQFYSSRIKCGVDAEPLHEIGVGCGIEVVTPFQRCMGRSQHREQESFINSVVFDGHIDLFQQFFVAYAQEMLSFFKIHDLSKAILFVRILQTS